MDLRIVMTALYASEINCGIQSFWDGAWQAWIGDEMNGIKAEDFNIPFDDLGEWLHDSALQAYPTSDYAKRWNAMVELVKNDPFTPSAANSETLSTKEK